MNSRSSKNKVFVLFFLWPFKCLFLSTNKKQRLGYIPNKLWKLPTPKHFLWESLELTGIKLLVLLFYLFSRFRSFFHRVQLSTLVGGSASPPLCSSYSVSLPFRPHGVVPSFPVSRRLELLCYSFSVLLDIDDSLLWYRRFFSL